MNQWDNKQFINNQRACAWWAGWVNKQIRFEWTGNGFQCDAGKAGEEKMKHGKVVALDWVCLHFQEAVLFLNKLFADWLLSLPAFKLFAHASAAFISAAVCRYGSCWQARLTNQLYSYYIAAWGPICNADGVPVLMLEAMMYSWFPPNHEGSWWTWHSTRGRSFISLPPAKCQDGRTDGSTAGWASLRVLLMDFVGLIGDKMSGFPTSC